MCVILGGNLPNRLSTIIMGFKCIFSPMPLCYFLARVGRLYIIGSVYSILIPGNNGSIIGGYRDRDITRNDELNSAKTSRYNQ